MKILRYIFISSLLLALPLVAPAQEQSETSKLWEFKGVSISADLFGYIGRIMNDYTSSEVAVSANFGNRFFPVVEIGYGSTDTTDETTRIYYKSSAPYFRAGLDYNFLYKKSGELSNYKIIGLVRYGQTTAKYDVTTPPLTDPVWGSEATLSLTDVETSCSWMEFGVGVQVKMWKNLHMGWSIRYKSLIKDGKGDQSQAWYIPGYGENENGCFGGTYTVIYNIPFGK
ncbi:MAG: hypothetical protein IKL54_07530 [Bacteroidaceae bacterium]|nr:hypothetical protein [Bacteroidaceae bacterium]